MCIHISNLCIFRTSYKSFDVYISDLSDFTESEDEDQDARRKRIERLYLKNIYLLSNIILL